MHCQILLSLLLMWLAVTVQAAAGDLTSPKGFSLSYPDAWHEASKEQLDKAAELTKKAVAGRVDVPTPVAIIFGPPSDGFAPNINVITVPGKIVLDANIEKAINEGVKGQFAAMQNGNAPEIKTGHVTIDSKTAMTLAYEKNDSNSGKTLRVWTVYLPGKKQMHIVTCTSLKTQWADAFPAFNETVKGMKIDLDDQSAGGAGNK